jgi:L-gulonate 5-dehydrogenase
MTKIPEKMKAAYLVQPRKFEIREVETPKICGERQVLVKTKAVGVCGSDLHAWNGAHKDVTMPAILGHEIVGEVVACGSAVTNVKVGDRVVREPIDYCGKCYACTHGRPNVCPDLKVWGFAHDGGHREYFVSECEKLYRFPDSVDWKVGAMIEPYTIAAEVNDRANICPGDTVMIHGLGPAGISVGDWAKYHGATVIASDVIPRRIATAQEFGLDYVLDAGKVNVAEEAMRITGGKGVNVLVDAAGFPGALDNALDLVSPLGRIVPLAINFASVPVNMTWVDLKEAAIVGSRLESGKFPVVIDELKAHEAHIRKLVTHTFPYTRINEAFELAASRNPDVCKIVVEYE